MTSECDIDATRHRLPATVAQREAMANHRLGAMPRGSGASVASRALATLRTVSMWCVRAFVALVAISFGIATSIDAQIKMGSSPVMIYSSAGIAIFAAAFLVGAHEAWVRKARLWAVALAAAWILTLGANMTLQLGGVASVKDEARSVAEARQAEAELDRVRREEVTRKLSSLREVAGSETAAMIRPSVAALEASHIFSRSKSCSNRTLPETLEHCGRLDAERRRLAAAQQVEELERKRAGWGDRIEPAPIAADPQIENVTSIARDLGITISEQSTRAFLNVAYIITLEIIGSLGALMAFAWGRPASHRVMGRGQILAVLTPQDDEGHNGLSSQDPAPAQIARPAQDEGQDRPRIALENKAYPADPAQTENPSIEGASESSVLPQDDATILPRTAQPILPKMKNIAMPSDGVTAADLEDVKSWVEDCLDATNADSRVAYGDAHDHYAAWCKARGRKPVPKSAFTLAMKALGWPEKESAGKAAKNYRAKVGGKVWFYGAEIRKQAALKVVK